ncbi:MAG: class I SAM-dependent methyltransferase [Candidatus Dormibacteria bacterium]
MAKRDASQADRFACTSDGVGTHGPIYWCEPCRVGYSPVPDIAWLQEQYLEVEDPHYFDQEQHRLDNASRLLGRVERWQRPGRLLEIGSSVGILLEAARRRGWRAHGIEASRWAVETGRARYGVDLELGTLESTVQRSGEADCVIMVDVLEHLVDPQMALERCQEWLAPGGTLAVTTVNMTAPIARLMGSRWPGFMDMHLTYFSPMALRTMLRRAGLSPLWLGPAPRRLSLGYVAGRLRGGGPVAEAAAAAAGGPGLRNLSVTLRSRDLLTVIARRPHHAP